MNRLQKLAGINELEINTNTSRKEILELLYEFNSYLLFMLFDHNSIQELLDEYGSNNLTEFYSEDEYSYEGDNLKKVISLTESYYKIIRPGDIHVIKEDSEPIPIHYKMIHVWNDEEENTVIFLTKF